MRYIYLIALTFLVAGCVAEDPMRVAMAKEKTIWAENTKAAQAAQLDRSAMAEADARNAMAMLLALQSQQAIAQGQATQAQALAQVEVVRVMADSKRSDNTLAIVIVVVLGVVAGVWIVSAARLKPVAHANVAPTLLYSSARYEAWLLPDSTIEYHRLGDGQVRVLMGEGGKQ